MHLPLAFSIHHFISSVGADAGFAAIIGLAILVLLYFAQARETTTLRDEAISASQRVEQLERRVAQLGKPPVAPPPESAETSAPAPPATTAAPAAPAGGLRPAPAAAAANPAAAASPASAAPATAAPGSQRAPLPASGPTRTPIPVPAAPAGVGAPALTDATRLIPATEAAREASSPPGQEAAEQAPPPAEEEAQRESSAPAEQGVRPATQAALATPPPATAAAEAGQNQAAAESQQPRAAANGGGEPPRTRPVAAGAADQLPPRIQIRRDGAPASGPVLLGERRGVGNRWLPALIGVLLLGAIVAVLLIVTSGGGSSTHTAATKSTNAPTAAGTKSAFQPASVTVAVLNGTNVSQLAHRVEQKLTRDGYKGGTAATAADQTHTTTVVGYVPGHQRDAAHVASSLGVATSAVQPVDQSARAVACPPPAPCGATVIVTVGSDLSSTQ